MPAEARPAATVVLLRDSAQGPQIFMVKRSARTRFMPDAHVFPGGRVDPADADVPVRGGEDDRARIGLADATAYQVAAVRETFEEAGMLLARGEPVEETRRALHAGEIGFAEAAARHGWEVDADALVYWSWWVTPQVERRRYSARFFVAQVPGDVDGVHDGTELVDSAWWTAAEALSRFDAGEIVLAPPTWYTLHELSRFDRADRVLAAARQRDTPPIEPTGFRDDEGITLLLPGDPDHPADFSLDGPTRVRFEAGRWLIRR